MWERVPLGVATPYSIRACKMKDIEFIVATPGGILAPCETIQFTVIIKMTISTGKVVIYWSGKECVGLARKSCPKVEFLQGCFFFFLVHI